MSNTTPPSKPAGAPLEAPLTSATPDEPPDLHLTVPNAETDVAPTLAAAGFSLALDFVSNEEELELLAAIDASAWDATLRRRTQHYGSRFDYLTKSVAEGGEHSTSGLPDFLSAISPRVAVQVTPWGGKAADQVTVNEYQPGTGISPHVDTHSAFHDGIAALSLGSGCVFKVQRAEGPDATVALWLPPRSLLTMVGAARYEWKHGIPGRKWDRVAGLAMRRGRRVSITFRRVLEAGNCTCGFERTCDSRGAGILLPTRITPGTPQLPAQSCSHTAGAHGDGLGAVQIVPTTVHTGHSTAHTALPTSHSASQNQVS